MFAFLTHLAVFTVSDYDQFRIKLTARRDDSLRRQVAMANEYLTPVVTLRVSFIQNVNDLARDPHSPIVIRFRWVHQPTLKLNAKFTFPSSHP